MRVPNDLLTVLDELAALHSAAAALSRRAYDLAALADSCSECERTRPINGPSSNGQIFVSTATCTVEWHGRSCVLGPSLALNLIHCLSRHPGRFYTYDTLMERVWRCQVSDDAVRALVKRLRRILTEAGMADLAEAIRGRERCYGLFLADLAP
jgi:DNA-binding response OmpR family regulator